jgi:hypothetical protein
LKTPDYSQPLPAGWFSIIGLFKPFNRREVGITENKHHRKSTPQHSLSQAGKNVGNQISLPNVGRSSSRPLYLKEIIRICLFLSDHRHGYLRLDI